MKILLFTGGISLMAIRQRVTRYDGVLLRVVFPLLYSSGLMGPVSRWQIWHRPAEEAAEPEGKAIPIRATEESAMPSPPPVLMRPERAA